MRVVACVVAVVAVVALATAGSAGAGGVFACPHVRGAVSYERAGVMHVYSFASCTDRVVRRPATTGSKGLRSAQGHVATIRATPSEQAILVDGKPVLRVHEDHSRVPGGVPGPLGLLMWSPDGRWLFYAIDPMSSQSIMADGLELRALDVATGRSVSVTRMLLNPDYMSWCGSTLVLTSGQIRLATFNKRLVLATAPDWQPRPLWHDSTRAFGSVACAPDGTSIAVLTQTAQGKDWSFFDTRWQLEQVALTGRHRTLDVPPRGCADESPVWSFGGRSLAFVRERNGYGSLMLEHDGRVYGPFVSLGYSLGYYGHHDWGIAWRG